LGPKIGPFWAKNWYAKGFGSGVILKDLKTGVKKASIFNVFLLKILTQMEKFHFLGTKPEPENDRF
jgi:hypothetical protein